MFPKTLAEQVDHNVNVDTHDQGTKELILELMGSPGLQWNVEEKEQALTVLTSQSPRQNSKLMYIASKVFRLRLLDVLAQALGLCVAGKTRLVPRAVRPDTTARKLDMVRGPGLPRVLTLIFF
jgi:hypothetical protein